MLSNIEHKIPLNNEYFFIIKKGLWNYSVDIIIEDYFDFNIFNLFYIFKCYVYENDVFFNSIYIIISNKEDLTFTYKKIDINLIKSCNFFIFVRFIEEFMNNEKEYIKNYKYIGFTLIFDKYSEIIKKNKIYPIYPIDDEIKKKLITNSIYNENYSTKILFLDEYKINIEEKLCKNMKKK